MNEGLCWWQFAVKYLPYIITAGIPLLVFALARILDKRKENQRKHGTYIALCHAIYVNLKTNLDYLGQIHARIFVGSYPSFRLRLSQKDSILNVIIPLCEDWGLLEKIEHAYDELDHIHSRMEEQLEMKQDADDKSIQGGPYRQNVDALNAAIHIRESLKPYRAGTVDLIGKTIKYIFDLLQEIALLVNEKLLEKEYLKKQYDKLQEEEQVLLIAKNNNVNIQDRPKFYERKSPEKSTGQIVDCSS